jgi:uncharacterized protein (DUF2336 family)
MIVRKFIHWSQNASASARADGVGALARAYLYSDMSDSERAEAEQTLFALLDDPSPLVRRALAESFASAAEAPPAIVLGLACDQSDIAAVVLARSPLLTDAQLIDCAAIGDSAAQAAIALRPELSAAVSAALAEIATREALIALAVNEGANLPDFALRRMIERFGHDGEMREALLGRAWLPGAARAALAAAAARQLAEFAVERNWLSKARSERLAQESRDGATMIIAAGCADYSDETAALAAYLRLSGQLTAGLALRALLCGQTDLFSATMVELTGIGPRRVAGLIKDPVSNAFAALYHRAGLPAPLLVAFRTALVAVTRAPRDETEAAEGALRLPIVQAVLRQCEAEGDEAFARLIALLRRFEAEAAREFGKRRMERMKQQATAADAPLQAEAKAPQIALATPAEPPMLVAEAAPEAPVAEAAPLVVEAAPPVEVAAAEVEIVIDFAALEKELIAA